MTRRTLVGALVLLTLVLVVALVPVATAQEDTSRCPDDILNWLVPTAGALSSGGSLNCRATPANLAALVPSEPPAGYVYVYDRAQGFGFYDVFAFGDLSGPIELCMRGTTGEDLEGHSLAVWSGVPNQWFVLPSFQSGDSICAQTERLGGFALVRIAAMDAPAAGDGTTTTTPAQPAATEEPAAPAGATPAPTATPFMLPTSPAIDMSQVTQGTEDTCIVRTKYIVRLRAEPNTTSEILDRVPWQTTMEADLKLVDGSWYRVRFFSDTGWLIGWINSRFLETAEPCEGLSTLG